ncbi:MAG: hypothetical protein ACRDLD_02450 [Thermoleophilaceae bacterium]
MEGGVRAVAAFCRDAEVCAPGAFCREACDRDAHAPEACARDVCGSES